MQLYLLRHAEAVNHAASDAERALTEKGVEQAHAVGRFCAKRKLAPDLVVTSPYLRASQTAQLVATALNATVETAGFLASGMRPECGAAELKSYERFGRLMIVGHEPDFSLLAAWLLGLRSNENLHLRKASLILLDLPAVAAGAATLEFSIHTGLLS
jgi:phosphohistidine phosphatase